LVSIDRTSLNQKKIPVGEDDKGRGETEGRVIQRRHRGEKAMLDKQRVAVPSTAMNPSAPKSSIQKKKGESRIKKFLSQCLTDRQAAQKFGCSHNPENQQLEKRGGRRGVDLRVGEVQKSANKDMTKGFKDQGSLKGEGGREAAKGST